MSTDDQPTRSPRQRLLKWFIDAALAEREYIGLKSCVSCFLRRPVSAAEGRCRICDRNRIVLGLLGGGGTCTGLALGAFSGGWWLGWLGAIAGSVIGAVTGGMLLVLLAARGLR